MSGDVAREELARDFATDYYAEYAICSDARLDESQELFEGLIGKSLAARGFRISRIAVSGLGERLDGRRMTGQWTAWFEGGGKYEGDFVGAVDIRNVEGEPWAIVSDIFMGKRGFRLS